MSTSSKSADTNLSQTFTNYSNYVNTSSNASGILQFFNDLPTPHAILMGNNSNLKSNTLLKKSTNNVNTYFKLKTLYGELKDTLNLINSIFSLNDEQLKEIKIPRSKYKYVMNQIIKTDLNKKKIQLVGDPNNVYENIFKKMDTETLKNIASEIQQNNGIVNTSTTSQPLFYTLFNNEYHEKDKNYLMEILDKYVSVQQKIMNMLKDNYGVFSLKYLFELNKPLTKNNSKNKNKTRKFNDEFNSYTFSKIKKTSSQSNNSSTQNFTQNSTQKATQKEYVDDELNYENFYNTNENEIIKKNENYNKYIKKLFDTMYKYIYYIVGENKNKNLYILFFQSLYLDFYTIKFFLNFVGLKNHKEYLQNKHKIDRYISNNIIIYRNYKRAYKEWHERKGKGNESISGQINNKLFNEYYTSYLKNFKLI